MEWSGLEQTLMKEIRCGNEQSGRVSEEMVFGAQCLEDAGKEGWMG